MLRSRRAPLFVLLLSCVIVAPASSARTTSLHPVASVEAQLLSLVNMERLRRHLPALRLTRSLRGAARLGSAAILDAGVFSHAPSWEARVRRTTRADGVAEALVWGAGSWATPEHLTAAWMASARHRAIFLDPALRRVGFGATVGSFEGHGLVVMVTADLATAH